MADRVAGTASDAIMCGDLDVGVASDLVHAKLVLRGV